MNTATAERLDVLILDDEEPVAQELAFCLAEGGVLTSQIRTTYRDLDHKLMASEFDAVSIDWEWHGAQRGLQLLRDLRRHQPEAGRVVFTKHEYSLQEARSGGADFVLLKPGDGDFSTYRSTIEQAAYLGINRKLVKLLRDTGLRSTMELETENEIREKATWIAMESLVNNSEQSELVRLLRRRGWWTLETFTSEQYVGLPHREKLRYLTSRAGLSAAQLAAILDEAPGANSEYSMLNLSDRTLSVFAFMLELSDYNLALLPYHCQVTDTYKNSTEPPPWDQQGLLTFLNNERTRGVMRAFAWIREH